MSFTAQEWKQDYETTKDLAIQLRTHGAATRSQAASLDQAIDRLDYRLGIMEQNPSQFNLAESETVRRRELVKGLRKQAGLVQRSPSGSGSGGGGAGGVGPLTLAQQRKNLISEQDDLLDDLGRGVDRLRQQGLNIRDETSLHKRLLDDIDGDVESAAASLRLEAKHAERIREQTSVCRLYLCIAILVIILILLLIIGFT